MSIGQYPVLGPSGDNDARAGFFDRFGASPVLFDLAGVDMDDAGADQIGNRSYYVAHPLKNRKTLSKPMPPLIREIAAVR